MLKVKLSVRGLQPVPIYVVRESPEQSETRAKLPERVEPLRLEQRILI